MLYNEDQKLILDAAQGMLSSVAPVSAFRDLRSQHTTAYSDDVWQAIAEMGWTAILVPEQYDGLSLSAIEAGIVAQEMGKHLTVSPFISSSVLATVALRESNNEALKSRLLPSMASGEIKVAFACDGGPRHNGKLSGIHCTVEGSHVSASIANVTDAQTANHVIVYLSVNGEPTLVCIDSNANGITSEELPMIDASAASKLTLTNIEIVDDAILAKGDEAKAIVETAVAYGRAILAAELLGSAEQAMHMTVEYLKERKQFGVLIGSFQALQHRAAMLYSEIELARSIVLNALNALANGQDNAAALAVAAKSKANDAAILAGQEGVQLHGGIGMTDEHDIGLYLKRIRTSSLKLGDSYQLKSLYATMAGF
ncbi:acyl-CoA dehydrogenase family protein [Maricurvus nonylphenolicus]|uniref:acyl-CoA dehydrogenase family protein n=1 Tax=Maricurvus nonylphenolicus TaxID=1008307 RepID=UPI0036F203C6